MRRRRNHHRNRRSSNFTPYRMRFVGDSDTMRLRSSGTTRGHPRITAGGGGGAAAAATIRPRRILVTGGAGYIGSHTVLKLVQCGYRVVIFDNLCNSSEESIRRVCSLSPDPNALPRFHQGDVRNASDLDSVFRSDGPFDHVIHFAGLKSVSESIREAELYYEVNVIGTQKLLEAMARHNCFSIVFSSSATVYGSASIPYTESSSTGVGLSNPYGQSKYLVEEILRRLQKDSAEWSVSVLRYFNPVGAHPSGLIGEDPLGVPNNLMPFITQVLVGRRQKLTVFGGDFDTLDGTCVRDFVHVEDLAEGHVAAVRHLESRGRSRWSVFNLGTGRGFSVLQLIAAMEKAAGKKISYEIGPRRDGDLPAFWATTDHAKTELGWQARRSLADMCEDAWRFQRQNPQGYQRSLNSPTAFSANPVGEKKALVVASAS